MIHYNPESRSFHLRTDSCSYIVSIGEAGHPLGLYFGSRINADDPGPNIRPNSFLPHANQTSYGTEHPQTILETTRLEYSGPGKGDYRDPSFRPVYSDGSRTYDFRFRTHRILPGKPALAGLPSARLIPGSDDPEAGTLELEFLDSAGGLTLLLSYTPLEDCDVICRNARYINTGGETVILEKAMSATLDLEVPGWKLTTLDGAWIRERHITRRSIKPGRTEVASRKGTSSADHSPFLALSHPSADNASGEVYGAALVYSGSHSCSVELSPHGITRMQMGINPESFRYVLEPGEEFQTPEAVFTHTRSGFNGLSDNLHRLVNHHIIPPRWREAPRPVLVNNWEATYMDFTEKKLLALADAAADAGMELFVLDDGWFGRRDRDDSSLGDWFVHRKKLPGGLKKLADRIRSRGLDFGIWVEPEMISEDSELFRLHPDWMVRAPGRTPSPARNQYLIDMVNPAVRDYLFDILSQVFTQSGAAYVKWDMNRNIGDAFSPVLPSGRQGEFGHRYFLGLYKLLDRLTGSFPDILFESCASGGNRFDMGMMYYMPQVWTSDDTDAAERLDIQEGSSLFAPPSVTGAHVSAIPNHQTLRKTPIETRFNVAAFGLLGYELDLTALKPFELKVIKKQIGFYKEHRNLLQFGRFFRLEHPESPDGFAWITVSQDSDRAVLGVFQKLSRANPGSLRIRLEGLDPERIYSVKGRNQYLDLNDMGDLASRALPVKLNADGKVFGALADRYMFPLEEFVLEAGGDELMYAGLRLPQRFHGGGYDETVAITGDFASRLYIISAVNPT